MIILLISLLIVLGLCFLALSTYLAYREFLPPKRHRKTPSKHPRKKVSSDGPGQKPLMEHLLSCSTISARLHSAINPL
jgi:hypothetical protein